MNCPEWHIDYFGDCGGCIIETAKKSERERIIKLLLETPEGLDALIDLLEYDNEGERLIALIKGENK